MLFPPTIHTLQGLLDNLDADLKYAIETEGKMDMGDVTNYAEVGGGVVSRLLLWAVFALQRDDQDRWRRS